MCMRVLAIVLIGLLIGLPVPPGYAQARRLVTVHRPPPLGRATGGVGGPDRPVPGRSRGDHSAGLDVSLGHRSGGPVSPKSETGQESQARPALG